MRCCAQDQTVARAEELARLKVKSNPTTDHPNVAALAEDVDAYTVEVSVLLDASDADGKDCSDAVAERE